MSDEKKVDEKKVGAVLEAFKLIREDNARIEEKLDRLLAHLGADRKGNGAGNGNGGASSGGSDAGAVATLADIQGQHGDFEVKASKNPRGWDGEICDGRMASECPPGFLEAYANFLDWKASNPPPGKEKSVKFQRLDAARCRRWAIEIREGRVKPKVQREMSPPPDDNGTSWNSGGGDPPPSDYDDGRGPPPGDDSIPF